jgi:histidyl-tRNA synthetase
MNDILPPDSGRWEALEDQVRRLMRRYAYENVRTPIVEPTALFVRGLGQVTDIVEKEMYSFVDRLNGEALTLRPENTAGVVRAAVEHALLYNGPKRLFYIGPMFRHALWKELGLTDVALQINSLGQPDERKMHRDALVAHFDQHHNVLDEEAKRRLHLNPLRLLDSKNPAMQTVIEAAPRLIDFLGAASKAHLATVTAILDANGVAYTINPRLVRGMDYYNLTVFEFVTTQLGAQGTICAGGRYDYLMEQVGGKPTPAVGWAMGVERVLDILKSQGSAQSLPLPDAYAIVPDAQALPAAMVCLQALREAGASVLMHASTPDGLASIKSQFKRADSSGARYALVFGADEMALGEVTVKPLREPDAPQVRRPLGQAAQWAHSLQSPA